MSSQILFLYDAKGKLTAVQIPAAIWEKLAPMAESLLEPQAEPKRHDLAAFAEFLSAWDFPYKYEPQVTCPHCQAHCANWQQSQSFTLLNANIGGLLVFHCHHCHGTIRQKFYKDHLACEFSPPAR